MMPSQRTNLTTIQVGVRLQTGMPTNYTSRSKELIYDALQTNPRFIKNPFGPQKLYLARPNRHW